MSTAAPISPSHARSDDSPLTEADRDRAPHHHASAREARCRACRCCRRNRRPQSTAHAAQMAALLARRSARRHQGVREAQRRVHGQHRAHRRRIGRFSAPCSHRCSIACTPELLRLERGAPMAALHRARSPFADRAAQPLRVVGSRSHPSPELAAYLAGLGPYEISRHGQLAENMSRRRGGCRHLSAPRPDVGMGHGRRAGYPRKCGRAYDRRSRSAVAVQLQRRPVEPAFSGVWRPAARLVGTDPEH